MKLFNLVYTPPNWRMRKKYKETYKNLGPKWNYLISRLEVKDKFKTPYMDGYNYLNSATDCIFLDVLEKYSKQHRFYHTPNHILNCLIEFKSIKQLAKNPNELELAIWFHDIIYDPKRHNNEEKSQKYAFDCLKKIKLPEKTIKKVSDLILITKHKTPPKTNDEKLIVDIDLSIFGQSKQVFDLYEKNIRKEYLWVPINIYKEKRIEILQSFFNKNPLYHIKEIHNKYEEIAKINLQRSINKLIK